MLTCMFWASHIKINTGTFGLLILWLKEETKTSSLAGLESGSVRAMSLVICPNYLFDKALPHWLSIHVKKGCRGEVRSESASLPQQSRASLHLYTSLQENVFHLAREIHANKPLQYEEMPPVQLGVLERVTAAAAVAVVTNFYSQTITEGSGHLKKTISLSSGQGNGLCYQNPLWGHSFQICRSDLLHTEQKNVLHESQGLFSPSLPLSLPSHSHLDPNELLTLVLAEGTPNTAILNQKVQG